MNYKNFLLIILFITSGCKTFDLTNNNKLILKQENFINKGFALTYAENLYVEKIISNKIDSRSLIIFQKNLKSGSKVRVKNLLNGTAIIAEVGFFSKYPSFYNSVLSQRISKELNIDIRNPYVEIFEILDNSSFIANKAKTFEEEKRVATKVPVDNISIKDLNDDSSISKEVKISKFNYIIKIADFYYKHTAILMTDRIINETKSKNVKIKELSSTQYRVYLGPFNNLNSLQKGFNDVDILEFENIEIIKND